MKVFIDHKWKITANCLFNNVRPDLVGVFVVVSNEAISNIDEIPANSKRLAELLSQAGISFSWGTDEAAKKGEFFLVVGNALFAER
jgi:hypothetical protein